MNIIEKDKTYVWHPFTQMQSAQDPINIVRAKGELLFDDRGNEYIDANSSWWVNVHGHGNEKIQKAIFDQFSKVDHTIFAGATNQPAVELAEKVVEKLGDPFKKVFFSDNGSTSVEVAIKMAIQYFYNKKEDRKRILALDGAYHGDTFGAMSAGQRGYFNRPFEPFFFEVEYLSFPDVDKETEILAYAERLLSWGDFACLIVEPLIQGSGGMRIYSSQFLDELVRIAKKYGTLVIFDEVMTGWGRTGRWFAMSHCDERPDIVCLSKGLTGGVLPLGLTVTTQKIFDAFLADDKLSAFLHGHSFTGNPLSSAAALASIRIFEEESTWKNIQAIENWNKETIQKLKAHTRIVDARMLGTILAIEIKVEDEGYFSELGEKIKSFMLENGILLRPLGNVIFINPPFCISREKYLHLVEVIIRFIET